MGDVLPLLDGNCTFKTMDGTEHRIEGKWDMIIAFPPCTYLTVSGNRWYSEERYGEAAIRRMKEREKAISFFMAFINADCDRIAVENPVGCMSTRYRKPDQIIHPWMFGENFSKGTCLWLKGLEPLIPEVTEEPELEWFEWYDDKAGRMKRQPLWYYEAFAKARTQEERAKIRSKTFLSIAKAMAEQWG